MQDTQQRRFPRTVVADKTDPFPGGNCKREIVEQQPVIGMARQRLGLQQYRHVGTLAGQPSKPTAIDERLALFP